MKRRLYFILPDLPQAERALKELLIKRVCVNQVHVLAKEGQDLGTLPEASVFQKYDIKHSLLVGMWLGGLFGVIVGIIAHNVLDLPLGGGLVATTIIGAILGAWGASMIGLMVPNIHLKEFHKHLERGRYLMMVDVPKERVDEIQEYIRRHHPQAGYKGVEPTIPSFP